MPSHGIYSMKMGEKPQDAAYNRQWEYDYKRTASLPDNSFNPGQPQPLLSTQATTVTTNTRQSRGISIDDVPSREANAMHHRLPRYQQEANTSLGMCSDLAKSGIVRDADSPPPLSDTCSPDKTTEKKYLNRQR